MIYEGGGGGGGGGSEINNPWSRGGGGSYIFRHMGVRISFHFRLRKKKTFHFLNAGPAVKCIPQSVAA